MESVLRREVERPRSAEWSREGDWVWLENRRIPTGNWKLGGEGSSLLVGEVEEPNKELRTCLVEHSTRGFLLLSTIL